MSGPDMTPYFAGEKLYADDFSPAELEAWYEDEREGYANLGAKDKTTYQYVYHALNHLYGFYLLPSQRFPAVLGYGSAYGHELEPILDRIDRITIVDPSDAFSHSDLQGVPVTYLRPTIEGHLSLPDQSIDLITCLGVLHHVANVTTVIKEFYRCLKPGGYALVREPVVSMGDWRQPRVGLTKRERGIPLPIFRRAMQEAGFEIINEQRCMFALTSRLNYIIKKPVYNSPLALAIDAIFCRLFQWNHCYHAVKVWQKLRPTAVFYVLTRPSKSWSITG